jgi:acetyl-CoA acetyltransferase
MRDVAVVSFAQAKSVRSDIGRNDVEILMPVVHEAVERSGIPAKQIGFTCSGSCDYLAGQPFAFVMALDAVGAWPPIQESHVEMDGAWALYEAWVRLQHGDVDSALVYGFGKSSLGDLPDILTQQLDPYTVAPLWPDSISIAALQARAMIDAGICTERDMAEVAVRSRRDAASNPNAQLTRNDKVDALLAEPCIASPLRKHDCAPISDGAAAVVLAAGDLARRVSKRPAWIRGIEHRIEPHQLGSRDLAQSRSTRRAAGGAGLALPGDGTTSNLGIAADSIDVAELHAPFSHQEILLRRALGLNGSTQINPSGGALAANPMMAAGLIRIGEAASRVIDGSADRAVAHATSGPCLQQNLVCVMEAE